MELETPEFDLVLFYLSFTDKTWRYRGFKVDIYVVGAGSPAGGRFRVGSEQLEN